MDNIPVSELYSLLIPLLGERLIVPRASVAEVISYQAPEEMAGAPAWYLGTISWNGRDVPVVSFEGGIGLFECEDTFEGRPIVVRFVWLGVTTDRPRWEQSFSDDGGETWETNWVNEWTRLDEPS